VTSDVEFGQSSYYTRNLINQFSIISNGEVAGYNIPLGAIKNTGLSNTIANSGRAQLNYDEIFGQHELSAIGGFEVRETKVEGNSSRIYGYDPEVGSSVPVDYNIRFTLFPSFSTTQIPGAPMIVPYILDRYRSYFTNASYTYSGKYTITGSARVDQSNLFGVKTNQKGVPLWSVGARWQIDKESFYHLPWLPVLRSRITYGYNGNIEKGVSAITTAAFYGSINLNSLPFAVIRTPGNPELRWEKIGMFNIAMDFGFKNQLLSGSIEYYSKRGKDLFGDALLASSSGFLQARGNFADMSGSGVDIDLNSVPVNKGAFSWTIHALFSYVRDEVTRNEGTNKQIGKPVNSVYSYKWGGLDPLTGDPIGYLGKDQSKDYSAIINASNEDPQLYVFSGRLSPQYFGGLRNTFRWKQFSASANITYKAGYVFRNSSIVYSSLFNSGYGHKDYSLRWQNPGDEQHTNVPSMVYPVNDNRDFFYANSEVNVLKGDHIRLQDINLTYDVNFSRWIKKPGSTLQLYFYANNLGIIWRENIKGIDPDYQTGFINPKSYSIGARIGM
ncbi:MAG: hypothetical protein J7497_14545, partial [Chitinophagaceae bacterium]|nr:hypothetical protein [Chitinophagaceae bacterium]